MNIIFGKYRFLLLIAFLVLSTQCFSAVKVGDLPYDKLGNDFSGEPIRVADYQGKVVILSFWATWCAPCMEELPLLINMQKLAKDHLQVIAINYQEKKRIYRKVVKLLSPTSVVFGRDPRGKVSQQYGVKAIPHMLIIDRAGKVRAVHIGYNKENLPSLIKEINAIIREGFNS